ncbi:XrtA system polysaccharide chain length determinant [Thiolapillus sp.]
MQLTLEQWVRGLRTEFRRQKVKLVLMFAIIALVMLAVGVYLPKRFESSTTILIGEKNIIEPLMEGRAVQTDVRSFGRNAREILSSRRVIEDVIQHGEWDLSKLSPVQLEMLMERIVDQTRVQNVGANLLKISYSDTDPQRAFKVTQRLAELFIRESTQTKQNESREAFEFIDDQVKQYHQKLLDAERNLKEFRGGNADARPGSQGDVDSMISRLRQQIGQTRLQLSEEREKEKSLLRQLSGEAVFSMHVGKEEQIRDRILELQNQKENLLLNFYETHPDVMRLTHQIEELERALQEEISLRKQAASNGEAEESLVQRSPLYQELRRQLAVTRTQIATLQTRLRLTEESLAEEMERSVRVANSEAQLAELTRDYEVNRNIYQDLLQRRESARVSMDMDMKGQSLAFIIKEPAALPIKPKGLGLRHIAAAGILLGVLIPIGYVALLMQFDPRVRLALAIRRDLGLRVLASIPPLYTPTQRIMNRMVTAILVVLVLAVFVTYGYVGYLRYTHTLVVPSLGIS